jgi:hypothetical protein
MPSFLPVVLLHILTLNAAPAYIANSRPGRKDGGIPLSDLLPIDSRLGYTPLTSSLGHEVREPYIFQNILAAQLMADSPIRFCTFMTMVFWIGSGHQAESLSMTSSASVVLDDDMKGHGNRLAIGKT